MSPEFVGTIPFARAAGFGEHGQGGSSERFVDEGVAPAWSEIPGSAQRRAVTGVRSRR